MNNFPITQKTNKAVTRQQILLALPELSLDVALLLVAQLLLIVFGSLFQPLVQFLL
jgi:hypothetical protein